MKSYQLLKVSIVNGSGSISSTYTNNELLLLSNNEVKPNLAVTWNSAENYTTVANDLTFEVDPTELFIEM